jgi:hypothetical protein
MHARERLLQTANGGFVVTASILRFRSHHDDEDYFAAAPDERDEDGAFDELTAGERIAPPQNGSPANTFLSALVAIAIGAAGVWAISQNPWALGSAVMMARTAIGATAAPDAPPAPAPVTELGAEEAVKQPLPEVAVVQAPASSAGEAMPLDDVAAAAPSGETAAAADEPESERLPPPSVDPKDPYQKRAAAVGLHPDISRVLLTKMSATDFRNADHAIKTALAKTADGETFVWPRKEEPKVARFEVRFVAGAPRDCRRYVVVVSKDRWSTTARPMETCGASAGVGRG